MKLKKGDRVEWKDSKGMRYGVVFKGGSARIVVMVDGGKFEVRGHVTAFTPSKHPLPNADEYNPMRDYSISGYKEIKGHGDTPTFHATIKFKGKKVIEAMNDGWGGCNMYQPVGSGTRASLGKFEKDAEKWVLLATGVDRTTESEGLWLEWEMFGRPYGITANESLKWLVEMEEKRAKKGEPSGLVG